jgi:uncharacterized protein YfaS (alpha-2-macroglobulin family)
MAKADSRFRDRLEMAKHHVIYHGVDYVFETEKDIYAPGESVHITLTYRNIGDSPLMRIFEFAYRLVLAVYDANDNTIYSHGVRDATGSAVVMLQPRKGVPV